MQLLLPLTTKNTLINLKIRNSIKSEKNMNRIKELVNKMGSYTELYRSTVFRLKKRENITKKLKKGRKSIKK